MKKFKYIFIATLLLSLSSCGLYSKFQAPELEDNTIVGQGVTLIEEPVDSLVHWQDYFGDKHLQELIELALEQNVDLRTARLNITQAERGLSSAKLAYVPSFSFAGEASVTRLASINTRSYTLPVVASWQVDLFGKLRNTKMQAQAVLEQTKLYERAVQSQIIAAVATNYYALILADKQLEVTRQSLEIMGESLEIIKAFKETGAQTQAAVEQYEASYKAIELVLESLDQSVKLTSNNINLLVNRSAQNLERGTSISVSPLSLEQSISLSALSARPDVLLSEAQLAQSFYGVNYARASLYPSISITGIAGFTLGEWLLSALGSITQPIFMANANRAALANAKDQYEQSLLAFNLSLLTAGKEVNDAMVSLRSSQRKVELAEAQKANLDRAVEMTKDLMSGGRANYLEVLVAQSSYLSSSLELESAKYEQAVSNISLYIALGGY